MTGHLTIAGLGPGSPDLITPAVKQAITVATDVVGYIPYVARIAPRDGLVLHPSDNRVEADRAYHALDMAAAGRRVKLHEDGAGGRSCVVAVPGSSGTVWEDCAKEELVLQAPPSVSSRHSPASVATLGLLLLSCDDLQGTSRGVYRPHVLYPSMFSPGPEKPHALSNTVCDMHLAESFRRHGSPQHHVHGWPDMPTDDTQSSHDSFELHARPPPRVAPER